MRKTFVAVAALLFLTTYLTSCIVVPHGGARHHGGYHRSRPAHHYHR